MGQLALLGIGRHPPLPPPPCRAKLCGMNKYEKAVDTWALRGVGQPFGAHTGVGKDLRQALVDVCAAADLKRWVGTEFVQAEFAAVFECDNTIGDACDALENTVADDSYPKLIAACRALATNDATYRELLLADLIHYGVD